MEIDMTSNIISNVTASPLMDMISLLNLDSKKSKFAEFDALLSNLLDKPPSDDEPDEEGNAILPTLYLGLLGALTSPSPDMETKPDALEDIKNTNCENITVNDYKQKVQQSVEQALLLPKDEIIEDEPKAISPKDFVGVLENKVDKIENLEIEESIDLSDKVEIKSPTAQPQEIRDIAVPLAEKLSSPKLRVKPEQSNDVAMSIKITPDSADIKVASIKTANDPTSDFTENDNNYSAIKSSVAEGEKVITEPKQSFDFNILQQNGINNNADSLSAVMKNSENQLTEVVGKQIVKSATYIDQNGKQEFEIQLKPEFLGKIAIKVSRGDDGMNIKITTSNITVKEMLTNQSLQIQNIIKGQGVEIKNVDVVYTGLTNSKGDLPNGNKYKHSGKKNTAKLKGEYEKSIIGGIINPNEKASLNYYGSVNYLV